MNNVTDYESAIEQAVAVAKRLAEMARSDLAQCESEMRVIGDGKKGAKLVHIEALEPWLNVYIKLQAYDKGEEAACLKSTLNTASKKVWECGTLGIQKAQGAYVFAITPPKEKTESTDELDKLLAEIKEAASGLPSEERAKFAAALRAKLGA